MKPSETISGSVERQLFVRALEKPVGEPRAAFLDGACGENAALRGRLEALLKKFESLGTFLEEPAVSAPDENKPRPAFPQQTVEMGAVTEKAGDRIGRYKLLQQIGEGGCGVVYMAEQEEPVRRRVALKVIRLGMDTKNVIARFEAERQALALMDHPNIARVLDAGATETGRPFFVMELVRGIKITDYCDQNNLPTGQRLDLFIQICRAIQHAHQKGIIHRDIKPSNILVTIYDGIPLPKVIDFGIAKATTDQRLTDKTLFTQFEQFIGTPAYMSPEQAEMGGLDIDTRSDIYSLGVLLYELLTGKTPFDSKELLAAGLDEMRRTIREKEPMRPSTRLGTMLEGELTTTAKRRACEAPKLIHALRGDLDWIVMKALEKDRTRRYDTANGLATDLQRHLNHEAVIARPPSPFYRLRKLAQRNRLAFAAAAAVTITLVIGSVVSTWQAIRVEKALKGEAKQHRQADEARQQAQANAQQAQLAQQRAEQTAADLRRNLYVADMGAASQALQDLRAGRARELVEKYLHHEPGTEDLRGYEWRLLWQRSRPNYEYSFKAYQGWAHCAIFSPDGRWLATCGDRLVIVWDYALRKQIKVLSNIDEDLDTRALAFSPDGHLLAAKAGHRVLVWRTDTWEKIAALSGVEPSPNRNNAVLFSPDGSTLATRVEAGVAFWNTVTWQKAELLLPGTGSFSGNGRVMAYSADARILAVSDEDELQIRDALAPLNVITNLIRQPADRSKRVQSLAISPEHVAVGYRDGVVALWRRATWNQVAFLKLPQTYLLGLDFSPNGALLAVGGHSEVVQLWAVKSIVQRAGVDSTPLLSLRGNLGDVNAISFAPDGQRLVSASADGTVKLWNPWQKPGQANLAGTRSAIAFSPDGRLLAAVHADGLAHIWDVQRETDCGSIEGLDTSQDDLGLAFSVDGSQLGLAVTNGDIQLWRLPSLTSPTRTLKGDGNPVVAMRMSQEPEPQYIAVLNRLQDQYRYCLYDLRTDSPYRVIETLRTKVTKVLWDPLNKFAFSPDGALLALINLDHGITLFDLHHGTERRIGDNSEPPFENLTFSPDGSRLAASANSKSAISIWDINSGRGPLNFNISSAMDLASLSITPDSKTLMTRDFDGMARFWSIALRKEILAIPDWRDVPLSGAWKTLVLAAPKERRGDGAVELVDIPSLEEIDRIEQVQIGQGTSGP
jgi:serine/threonine protein kinase/WD40 repeat protein